MDIYNNKNKNYFNNNHKKIINNSNNKLKKEVKFSTNFNRKKTYKNKIKKKISYGFINYHFLNTVFLKKFLNARLELKNRNQNFLNRKHQKKVEKYVKIARKLNLLPHIKYS